MVKSKILVLSAIVLLGTSMSAYAYNCYDLNNGSGKTGGGCTDHTQGANCDNGSVTVEGNCGPDTSVAGEAKLCGAITKTTVYNWAPTPTFGSSCANNPCKTTTVAGTYYTYPAYTPCDN